MVNAFVLKIPQPDNFVIGNQVPLMRIKHAQRKSLENQFGHSVVLPNRSWQLVQQKFVCRGVG